MVSGTNIPLVWHVLFTYWPNRKGCCNFSIFYQALGDVACWFLPGRLSTHMALIVQLVVSKFQLVEADHLSHPSLPRGRRVWMNIYPGWHRGISIACHHPFRTVVNIPTRQKQNSQTVDGLPQFLKLPTKTRHAHFLNINLILYTPKISL